MRISACGHAPLTRRNSVTIRACSTASSTTRIRIMSQNERAKHGQERNERKERDASSPTEYTGNPAAEAAEESVDRAARALLERPAVDRTQLRRNRVAVLEVLG